MMIIVLIQIKLMKKNKYFFSLIYIYFIFPENGDGTFTCPRLPASHNLLPRGWLRYWSPASFREDMNSTTPSTVGDSGCCAKL